MLKQNHMLENNSHDISCLSYNLRFHAAYTEAVDLAHKHAVDILCLQECYTTELADVVGEFTLAHKTSASHLGLAIYYRTSRFTVTNTCTILLTESLYERVRPLTRERLVLAELYDTIRETPLLVASFHASHLVASNYLRRKQMREMFAQIEERIPTDHQIPTIIAGDYNYPWFQRKLKRFIRKHGYLLSISEDPTFKNTIFKGKFDFVSARHITQMNLSVLPQGLSDHMPVHVKVTYAMPEPLLADSSSLL